MNTETLILACSNCGTIYTQDELDPIDDIFERVMPGEIMPYGQCPDPDCAALVHSLDKLGWPIRVDGIYEFDCASIGRPNILQRVTAIDGDQVHTVIRTMHPAFGFREHSPDIYDLDRFRRLHLPTDRSRPSPSDGTLAITEVPHDGQ